MYNKKQVDIFLKKINQFVSSQLEDCSPKKSSNKIIHDPIWGSVMYYSWEIQIIDTPLIQRLRGINQLGISELTYPAARHSRYEHSLGTAAIASRMIEKLKERYSLDSDDIYDITDRDLYVVRLTALLHDVGHCAYSHLSEQVYKHMPDFQNIIKYINDTCGQNVHPKPHEILSYLVITSSAFCDFFHKHIDFPKKGGKIACRTLLREVANMVIGVKNFRQQKDKLVCRSFMTDIINSDFDADKLDYTQRDSYTSGIALAYGVERFLMKIVILQEENDDYINLRLAITSDALITVEELIFNRKILYVQMYRHQKVLSTEAVIRDILYGIVALGYVKHPSDFLYISDSDVVRYATSKDCPFPEYAPKRTLVSFEKTIKNRSTPKRCLMVGKNNLIVKNGADTNKEKIVNTLSTLEKNTAFDKRCEILKEFGETYAKETPDRLLIEKVTELCTKLSKSDYIENIRIRQRFYDILCEEYKRKGKKIDFDLFDLYIEFPSILKDKTSLPIKDSEFMGTASFASYVKDWSDAFSWDKWRGYFYCGGKVDRFLAKKAAITFFEELCPDLEILCTDG